MRGFQPIYSGTTLTQAAAGAARSIMAGAEIQARMYESTGKAIGGALEGIGKMAAAGISDAANAPTQEQVDKAIDAGALPEGSKAKTGFWSGGVGESQYKNALGNRMELLRVQEAAIKLEDAQGRVNFAAKARTRLLEDLPGKLPETKLGYDQFGGGGQLMDTIEKSPMRSGPHSSFKASKFNFVMPDDGGSYGR